MNSRSDKFTPRNSPIWSDETNQPFARRTTSAFIGLAIAVISVGLFSWWFFLTPSSDNSAAGIRDQNIKRAQQMPGNKYAPGSGRSSVYNFFYNMFDGAEDGLDKRSLSTIEAMQTLDRHAEILANIDDNYRHSVHDVVGSDVIGKNGENAGIVYDIVIKKETGEARAVIVDQDGAYYQRNLISLRFKKILKQQPDGDVHATVTEDTLEDKTQFEYSKIPEQLISLRHLHDGQVLDYEGNVAGQVDAIIYQNAEAQRIYFQLAPSASPDGKVITFGIPYEAAEIVINPDGYDIQLSKEQTISLAKSLFGNSQ